MNDLEHGDAFLKETTEKWTAFMLERLKANVRSEQVIDSAEFLESIAAKAAQQGLMRYQVELRYARQGRFADMGAGKGYIKGQFQGRLQRGQRLRGRKGNKVYSRTAYGTLSTLMNNVANQYIKLVPDLIKHNLTT
jgi:hypothetical protein